MGCVIEDNGVGRNASEASKSADRPGHNSLALDITRERIEILNKTKKTKIHLMIEDLHSDNNTASGTRVILLMALIKE